MNRRVWLLGVMGVVGASVGATALNGCGGDDNSNGNGGGDSGTADTGTIVIDSGTKDSGGGGLCGPGTTTCGDRCVDEQVDPKNCGSCGTTCDATQVCSSGKCASSCPTGDVVCSGGCVDPHADRNHCGATGDCTGGNAGTACVSGNVCADGVCAPSCLPGQILCGADCVNPATDNQYCGASGNCTNSSVVDGGFVDAGQGNSAGTACAAGSVCSSGSCQPTCGSGTIECGGGCIDPLTSNQYCGATGACGVVDDAGVDGGSMGQACDGHSACIQGVCSAVYCTSENDGALDVTVDTTLPAGDYNYSTFHVEPGVTLTFTGTVPVVIRADTAIIDGTIDIRGGNGADSDPALSVPNGGTGGPGGGGGGGGGGDGPYCATSPKGTGGAPNGVTPPSDGSGGAGGLALNVSVNPATGGDFDQGTGGGGGGSSVAGGRGSTVFTTPTNGLGGDPYSDQMMTLFTGGSGGGGGGANGGGGGGGGGAIRISAGTISVSATGAILATGGNGGTKDSGGCGSGAGGAGSGGMVWLDSIFSLDVSGTLNASAGAAGLANDNGGAGTASGGTGADGRIQLDSGGTVGTSGTIAPAAFVRPTRPSCP